MAKLVLKMTVPENVPGYLSGDVELDCGSLMEVFPSGTINLADIDTSAESNFPVDELENVAKLARLAVRIMNRDVVVKLVPKKGK